MAIWTAVIDYDSDAGGYALLLNSVTMRPLNLPLFQDAAEAESFLAYAQEIDMGDVRALGHDTLDRLHTAWLLTRQGPRALAETAANDHG